MATTTLEKKSGIYEGLDQYMSEVKRMSLLSREEESALAFRLRDEEDVEAAHRLVTANLRFVVKIAFEYKSYGMRLLDLVQEGNIGLMHAVRKFDPDRGYRLITYAVWWIRAYIQAHLLASWSLVRMGTTQAQRRLFFKLKSAKRELGAGLVDMSSEERHLALATALGVRGKDVSEMEMRLAARDFSLDVTLDDESGNTHKDLLASGADTEAIVERRLVSDRQSVAIKDALDVLSERERDIITMRFFSDTPLTLREIGAQFGVSRERARQIESAAKDKMRKVLVARGDLPAILDEGIVVVELAAAAA